MNDAEGIFCSVIYVASLWQEKQLEVLLVHTHYKDFPPIGGPVIAGTRYTVVPMKEGKKRFPNGHFVDTSDLFSHGELPRQNQRDPKTLGSNQMDVP